MNTRSSLLCLLLSALMLAFGSQATAQTIYSGHGATCSGIGKVHSNRLIIDELGAYNKDSNKNVWVACPVVSEFLDDPSADTIIFVNVANAGNSTVNFSCTLEALEANGGLISRSRSEFVASGDVVTLDWELPNTELLEAVAICKMPPRSYIFGYMGGFGF